MMSGQRANIKISDKDDFDGMLHDQFMAKIEVMIVKAE